MTDISAREFQTPGRGRGLMDVFKNRFLLKLLVDKEIQVRYRGSVLGIVWSYIKPGVQFLVFYLALGVFLGLNGTVVKSHGSADATGLSAAIKLAFQLAKSGFQDRLAARVAQAAEQAATATAPTPGPTGDNG